MKKKGLRPPVCAKIDEGFPMKLLDEIIELATSESGSVSTLLRKCLVLAHDLKNEKLRAWAEKELNGYQVDDEMPEYRKAPAIAKGFFIGSFGRQINDQPIPAGALHEKHRHYAESVELFQPIASYEKTDTESRFIFEWPANLTAIYQRTFFKGQFVLNRAWQEISSSVFIGLVDTIKTRVLRFALELKRDLGQVGDHIDRLTKEKVDQSVNNYIYGGNVVIASSGFTQIGITVEKGNWPGLSHALEKLGVPSAEITDLRSALDQDSAAGSRPGLGERAKAWLAKIGADSGKALLNVGVEVAKAEAKKYIAGYLGLPPL